MSILERRLAAGKIINFKSNNKDFKDDTYIIMETTSNRWGTVCKVLSCISAEEFIFQEVQPTGDHYLDLIEPEVNKHVKSHLHYHYGTADKDELNDPSLYDEIRWECHDEMCENNPVIYTLLKEHDDWGGRFNDFDPRYPHLLSSAADGTFSVDCECGRC